VEVPQRLPDRNAVRAQGHARLAVRGLDDGATQRLRNIFGSARLRYFGPRPLIEDGSVNSKGTTIWNGEVGYRLSNKVRLVLEAFNIFAANVADIDYFYASRLPGEAAGGVEDIHTHPVLPRSARVGIQLSF